MPVTTLPEVDAYIANAEPFARPLLQRIRRAFHRADGGIEEAIKWGTPHFVKQGIVGGMAAFQSHVTFGFWKAKLLDDPEGLFERGRKASMCAVRAGTLADLPKQAVLVDYIRRAVRLNEEGTKVPASKGRRSAPPTPDDLTKALKRHVAARRFFEGLAPSHRRDYIQWITEAKRPETRQKRLATTLEWLAEGKRRNWKYERGSQARS